MTEFVIARYGSDDYRLIRYDGSEVEVSVWTNQPTLREASNALMEYHGAGNQPFGSREGALDSLELANQWPLAVRDTTLPDETLPWHDSN